MARDGRRSVLFETTEEVFVTGDYTICEECFIAQAEVRVPSMIPVKATYYAPNDPIPVRFDSDGRPTAFPLQFEWVDVCRSCVPKYRERTLA